MGPCSVVYVGGTGRSGSTVVANVLGELPGCVSVGELRYVWERGLTENRLCGCGRNFLECPFWAEVLAVAFPGGVPEADAMRRLQESATRLRALPRLAVLRRDPEQLTASLGSLPASLTALYRAVAQVSGADFIVDSSKLPSYALLLDSLPELDVRLLHLVRDPRACAFSWRRRKPQPDGRRGGYMERRGVTKSVSLWLVWNAVTESAWRRRGGRYVRATYEGFVAQPRASVARVADVLGLPAADPSLFVDDTTVRLGRSHTVAGNPARLRSGDVHLALDDEWRSAMPARDRVLATVGAAPLLGRYGYGWHVRDAST